MADRTMKKGDTYPPLRATLTADGVALDLTGASAVNALIVGPSTTLTATCTVLSPSTAGRVEYEWQAGDTDEVGSHQIEFVVTWSATEEETVPNTGVRELVIEEDLATP